MSSRPPRPGGGDGSPVPSRRMRACSARVMGPSLSSAAYARASAATPPTSGKALPKRAPASPEAVRAFVRKREEEFLKSSGSEERVSSSLRRLVRAQTRALERSLDRETGDRRDDAEKAEREDAETAMMVNDAASAVPRDQKRLETRAGRLHPFPDETLDVLFRRRLLLLQARRGYRCNVDSLLLAARASEALRRRFFFRREKTAPRVADLGAGCGVVGLAVALGRPRRDDGSGSGSGTGSFSRDGDADGAPVRLLSIEKQASLASRCARNAALNGLSDRVSVCLADVAAIAEPRAYLRKPSANPPPPNANANTNEARTRESALRPWLRNCDAVVVNPPYYPRDAARAAGTPPRDAERRDAHYETTATLLDFARAAEALLRFADDGDRASSSDEKEEPHRPTAHFVYPADRAAAVAAACAAAGLGDVTIKNVFTDEGARAANDAPVLALIDARRPAGRDSERDGDEGQKMLETRRFDGSGVLYADAARRTYDAEVETFMRDLGL